MVRHAHGEPHPHRMPIIRVYSCIWKLKNPGSTYGHLSFCREVVDLSGILRDRTVTSLRLNLCRPRVFVDAALEPKAPNFLRYLFFCQILTEVFSPTPTSWVREWDPLYAAPRGRKGGSTHIGKMTATGINFEMAIRADPYSLMPESLNDFLTSPSS